MAPISGFTADVSTNDIKSKGIRAGLRVKLIDGKVVLPVNLMRQLGGDLAIDDERWAGVQVSVWIDGKKLSRSALYLESHNLHK